MAGLSLQELADMYGGTKSHCWTLEEDRSSPTLATAYAIAKVLDKTVYDIWPDETEIVEETIIVRKIKKTPKR
jgi:DNA-binding XRE family transcriptional regulator